MLSYQIGPDYCYDDIFRLGLMRPYSLSDIYEPISKLTPDIVLYLPRTSDLNELAIYVPEHCKISVIHYCIKGYSKVGILNKAIVS